MKALVGAFNQEKALVGAFSVIVQPVVEPMEHYTALIKPPTSNMCTAGVRAAPEHAGPHPPLRPLQPEQAGVHHQRRRAQREQPAHDAAQR